MTVRKWGAEALVNTNTSDEQFGSKLVGLADGGYVVSWTDEDAGGGDGSGNSVKFQRYDAAGGRIGGEVIANFDAAGSQFNGSLVATGSGGFVAAWTDTGSTEYRRFAATGTALDAADRDLVLTGAQFVPRLATFGSGFVMAYQDDNDTGNLDIRVQRFLPTGEIDGAAIDVATSANSESGPAIAELVGGGFAVAWSDGTTGNVRVRAFNTAGVQTIAATTVSTGGDSAEASITALADGNFVVAWTDGTDSSVRARLVFSGGLGDIFAVSTHAAQSQETPNLAALPDGGFVAIYESDGDIRGQVFDAFGARDGGEFVVNTSTLSVQTTAAVTVLADGRFVVTWADVGSRPDDPISSIRQQIFDPRDGVVTGTEQAETLYGHDLVNDEINGLGGSDRLDGLGGADNLYGGDGGDTYVVGAGDTVFEFSGGGTDLVLSSVSFALGANVENLTLTGVGKINAAGNGLANVLIGNAAANVLAAGLGIDTLSGGGGPDRFDFNAVSESAVGTGNRDTIIGFSHAQHDRIDLATIDANQTAGHAGNQAFVFIGTQTFAAHAGSGEIRRGPGGIIQINVDGDNAPEMEIGVGATLVAGDFVL